MRHFSAEVLIYWYLLCFCCHANSLQCGFKGTGTGSQLQTEPAVQENHKGLFFFPKVLYESGDLRIAIVFVVVTVFYLFPFFLCLVTDSAKVQTPRFTGSFTLCFSETRPGPSDLLLPSPPPPILLVVDWIFFIFYIISWICRSSCLTRKGILFKSQRCAWASEVLLQTGRWTPAANRILSFLWRCKCTLPKQENSNIPSSMAAASAPPDWNGSFAEPQQTPVPLLLPPARADGVGNCRVSAGLQAEAMGADIPAPPNTRRVRRRTLVWALYTQFNVQAACCCEEPVPGCRGSVSKTFSFGSILNAVTCLRFFRCHLTVSWVVAICSAL